MGRQKNDGRGRLGGRAKGTKNTPAEPLDVWAAGLINRRRAQFEADLETLTPQERAHVLGGIIAATLGTPAEPQPTAAE